MPDQPISIAQYYHERTKYDPQTIASKSKGLDWSQQPHPFKEYKIGQTFDLKPYLSRQTVPQKGDFWRRISRILGCSYGLTAKIATMGSPLYLRSAPSAGGLYPAEVYLISRGTEFLPAGLYSYQGQSHSLLLFWESDVWTNLQSACFWNPVLENTDIALVTSAIFYRSAWRYEDRAYRRIFLDTGHLLGNIELSASINDYRAHLIGGFNDSQMNELLYLDSEKESVMTVIPLADLLNIRQNLPHSTTALPSATTTLYPKIPEGELLNSLHRATIIATDEKIEATVTPSNWEDKYNFPFCLKVSVTSRPVNWGEDLIDLESTMLKRRSTRAYSGASLSLDELRALLHFTYQPQDYASQNLDPNPDYFALDLLETFIAVSAVTGLEEGCYYYAPKAQELRQIRFKNFQQELHYLCLGQDLGRDAAAVVFHTADLSKAVAKYGDRVYRYLHADAGHLGQRLNLAAIHLGLGVSGIGGFFDDQVNEVLGIPSDEAVIYITTLGRPKVF
ncbi:MAG: SagB/ThcOx family dehydrogenase [Microcystis sp. M015S2]|uniref:SagB/ThcOx family dehydrogenase n=1 Tax=unclassified Microcystis TaxID=2643300 RepID=UPI00258E7572|nr:MULTISPECIES: SagB/ThcOx family dehydrogenase [unclassified Microcystis]MCA2709544.1 SagB/ThcOx family dehydrogenase [Microcystis sp. M025S2]MCA2743829.1 SagB/ThcOx family dehydrogenase [Microcystis sp. M015S2]MCA2758782.1 SagB/ThcOx family dehydrogenase [Microcystis sp. M145S2]